MILTATLRYEPDTFHFCDEMPVPSDSIAQYLLDIDKDGIDDFKLNVKRWTYVGVGSSFQLQPCLRYQNFRTTINPLNDSNKIAVKKGTPLANEFLIHDVISMNSDWSGNVWSLYTSSVEHQYFYAPDTSEYYLGIQLFKENKYYFGWILMNVSQDQIVLKEQAINLSDNKSIIAGQKQ